MEDWESEERQETGTTDAMPGTALKDSLLFESKYLFCFKLDPSLSISDSFLTPTPLSPSLPIHLCRGSGGQ